MTAKERRNPHMLTDDARKASRKKRIASGAGVNVEQVNRLIKQHRQMADMMKAMGGAQGKRGMMGQLGQMMGFGGGGQMPSPEQIEAMQKQMGGAGGACRLAARPAGGPAARRLQPSRPVPRRRRPQAARPRRRFNPFGGKKK